MNPRLVKFAVELQNAEQVEKKEKAIYFKNGTENRFFNFFNILKAAKVTIPVNKN